MLKKVKTKKAVKKTKEYLVVGAGYTVTCKSLKERTAFKKQVKDTYKLLVKNPKFTNKQALYISISISVAKTMKLPLKTKY
ncbi:MAG: hypothetical protein WCT85_00635 [Parachlamydiales bacterium]